MPKAKPLEQLLLQIESTGDAWLVRGSKTFDYRIELRKGGGVWSKDIAAWSFKTNPESLITKLNEDTRAEEEAKHRARQERGRQLSKAKAQKAEWKAKRQAEDDEWQRLWTDPASRAEIDRVNAELFARRSFWPLTLENPFCHYCHIHIPWNLYCNADKDLDKAAQSYYMSCSRCLTDFTR